MQIKGWLWCCFSRYNFSIKDTRYHPWLSCNIWYQKPPVKFWCSGLDIGLNSIKVKFKPTLNVNIFPLKLSISYGLDYFFSPRLNFHWWILPFQKYFVQDFYLEFLEWTMVHCNYIYIFAYSLSRFLISWTLVFTSIGIFFDSFLFV